MCGICGVIDFKTPVARGTLEAMCSRLAHRGPDDQGIYLRENAPWAGLGHRRLSIIDLSPAGHQPMANEDGSCRIVLNGEIYNFHDLRKQLQEKGHRFRSGSDTETVLHLYEEYGRDCVKHLRGMFAFALWDERARRLLLARDRIGKKPLWYRIDGSRVCFASELASLSAGDKGIRTFSPQALDAYLTFGYVPAPMSIFQEVFKLPPGHTLTIEEGTQELTRYWDLSYVPKAKIDEEEACRELTRILKEAVRIRLYSDVPLGAFLSGGVDSSIIVGLMSTLMGRKVKTFSIGFDDPEFDELAFAREVAGRFGTEHQEFIVKPRALEVIPELVARYGEPYADSSSIPTYYVAKLTRQQVTVALNGDGGDESFAGYERYQAMCAAEVLAGLPHPMQKGLFRLSRCLPDSLNPKNRLRNIRRFFDAAALERPQRYLRWISIFDDRSKEALYSPEMARSIDAGLNIARFTPFLQKPGTLLDRVLDLDVHTYLPDDLLVKTDIATMTHSLEARSPLLDHEVMEFAASLPAHMKIRGGCKKYLLKKAFKHMLPPAVLSRRKMGFGVPIGAWFRGELAGFLKDTLLDQKSLKRGYFQPEAVRTLVKEHTLGKRDHSFRLWSLLMLEMWHRRDNAK